MSADKETIRGYLQTALSDPASAELSDNGIVTRVATDAGRDPQTIRKHWDAMARDGALRERSHSRPSQKARLVDFVRAQGDAGATCDEAAQALKLACQSSASARWAEAHEEGLLTKTGEKRRTGTGKMAEVFVVAPADMPPPFAGIPDPSLGAERREALARKRAQDAARRAPLRAAQEEEEERWRVEHEAIGGAIAGPRARRALSAQARISKAMSEALLTMIRISQDPELLDTDLRETEKNLRAEFRISAKAKRIAVIGGSISKQLP